MTQFIKKFVKDESGTCGDSDVDNERRATNLSKLLQKVYAAGVKEGERRA